MRIYFVFLVILLVIILPNRPHYNINEQNALYAQSTPKETTRQGGKGETKRFQRPFKEEKLEQEIKNKQKTRKKKTTRKRDDGIIRIAIAAPKTGNFSIPGNAIIKGIILGMKKRGVISKDTLDNIYKKIDSNAEFLITKEDNTVNTKEQFGSNFEVINYSIDDCANDDVNGKAKETANYIVNFKDKKDNKYKPIDIVIGHVCSAASLEAATIYNENDIIQITTSSSVPSLTQKKYKNLYRLSVRDDIQAGIAARWIEDFGTSNKIAILNDGSNYGKGLADSVISGLMRRDTIRTSSYTYIKGYDNTKNLINKLKEQKINIIYYGGNIDSLSNLVNQMAEQEYNPVILSGDALQSKQLWLDVKSRIEDKDFRIMFTHSEIPTEENYLKLVDAEQKNSINTVKNNNNNNEQEIIYAMHAFAASEIILQGVKFLKDNEEDYSTQSFSNTLTNSEFKTVLGPVDFDKNGDWKNIQYHIYLWNNGDYYKVF